jgi:hypothetical protein
MMPRPCLICGHLEHHTRDHYAWGVADDVADLDAAIGTWLATYACLFIAALLIAALGC